MKVYVLCSYGDSLNDPSISTDYQEIYEKMEKSYKMVLEDVYQTEEEKEYIEIYKDMLEDGEISERRRKILNKEAESLGIPHSRVNELEEMV